MTGQTILKEKKHSASRFNLEAYDETYRQFSWEDVRADFTSLGIPSYSNIALASVEKQVGRGLGSKTALRWLAKDGTASVFTYDDLSKNSSRFASALKGLNVASGDVVFTMLGRVPELYIAALGTWKSGAVFCPLFSAFGPEPARARMEIAKATVLVTTQRNYQRKIAPIRDKLPSLKHIILVGGGNIGHDFHALLAQGNEEFAIASTNPDDLAILHFTSGTTGKPKGVMHVHEAVITHHATARFALDLHEDDVFWCTADPGWVTGTSYGIIAPLAIGCTLLSEEREFDAERWYKTLSEEKVTVWYTAPTAIRMLMKAGSDLAANYDLTKLRFIASVGEPLNPEAVIWGEKNAWPANP